MIFATEVETKYKADSIKLSEFSDFCTHLKPTSYILASGWDYFYDKQSSDGFARHRIGPDFNQLTFKRKTNESNNFIRDEDNLDLEQRTTVKQVASFLDKFGYSHNKSIYKNCFIYKYPTYTSVYYVIYDTQIKEIGRYVEIEMCEDYNWADENEAWNALLDIEKRYNIIGINARGRMKKSLYELVCK